MNTSGNSINKLEKNKNNDSLTLNSTATEKKMRNQKFSKSNDKKYSFKSNNKDIIYTDYVYLKSHCGKTEKCYETEEGIFQCGEKILLQKIGDDCGINEECFTGLCIHFGRQRFTEGCIPEADDLGG